MKTYTYTIHLTETERIVLLNCLNKCKDIARINKECTTMPRKKCSTIKEMKTSSVSFGKKYTLADLISFDATSPAT